MATTMQFGPEWMRTKQQANIRSTAVTSPPPPTIASPSTANGHPAASSYSSLVTPQPVSQEIAQDVAHPFKYSKDDMLRIWREGGGGHDLPIEVERWEGVVREAGGEPICSKNMSEAEKRLFSSSLNSEIRRRQSSDFNGNQGERPRLYHAGSSHGGGPRDNLGLIARRRRGDSSGSEQPPLTIPRKQSWSTGQGGLSSPVASSPRTRFVAGSGGKPTGFDGVLNGNDAWGAGKRRASSGQLAGSRVDETDLDKGAGSAGIKEEDEDSGVGSGNQMSGGQPGSDSTSQLQPSAAEFGNIREGVSKLSVSGPANESESFVPLSDANGLSNGPPDDVANFTSIQWTYLDPSGNVQGPFPSDTMQSWYDQQYFPDDLPMKRINIDNTWMTVADIRHRAAAEQIFLSPLRDVSSPPGLPRTALDTSVASLYGRTRQYLQDQTSTVSASPSSSFGGGFGRSTALLEPVAFGSRQVNQIFAVEQAMGSTVAQYSLTGSPSLSMSSRRGFHDATPDPSLAAQPNFTAVSPNRSTSFDAQPIAAAVMQNTMWQSQHSGAGWDGGNRGPLEYNDQYSSAGAIDPMQGPVNGVPLYVNDDGTQIRDNNGMQLLGSRAQQEIFIDRNAMTHGAYRDAGLTFEPMSMIDSFPGNEGHVPIQPQLNSTASNQHQVETGQRRASPRAASGHGFPQNAGGLTTTSSPAFVQPNTPVRQASWGIPTEAALRPSPFDPDIPNSRNTFITRQPSPPPRATTWQESQNNVQAWLTESQRASGNEWGQVPENAKSYVSSDVNADDAAPEQPMSSDAKPPGKTEDQSESTGRKTDMRKKSSPARDLPVVSLPKRKEPEIQSSSADSADDSKPTPAPPSSGSTTKAPWATEDDAKAKTSAAPISLREIQELEMKKQDVKKATAEKEHERIAKAPATTETTFTATWGLPTSQVGVRTPSVLTPKEPPSVNAPTTSSPSPPVWTNAVKPPAKKSMKEIQEEEERRKKAQAKEKESVAATVKRAYGETAAKQPVPASSTGGVWTTVGTNGKMNSTPRPTITPSTSQNVAPSAATVKVPSSTPSVTRPVQPSKSVAAVVAKQDEEPAPPSLEFLKWLKDSLRGLNSSVQFEEIAQMLLSFPLDPDPSTVELIAETVYGASTTLDGRRFAAEFVAKRKVDNAARPKTAGVKPTSTSLAEVVKTQPKPQQSEWAYKVVKKKGKGGGKS